MGIQEFTAYQLTFRPAGDAANIRTEWNAKSMSEKQRWTKAYNAIRVLLSRLLRKKAALDRDYNAFNYQWQNDLIVITTVDQYEQWLDRAGHIKTGYERLDPLHRKYARLWTALANLETAQAGHNANSVQHAQAEHRAARRRIGRWERRAQALTNMLETPPVAQDPQNRKRMPDNWLPDRMIRNDIVFRGATQYDIGHHLPRLSMAAPLNWRCAQQIHGGQAIGTVWLGFDWISEEIEDRVFRKDVRLAEHSWFDPTRMYGDLRSLDRKQPLEIKITNDMWNRCNTAYTVRPREALDRNHHINNDTCSYRIYLEYMSKGSLGELINVHRAQGVRIPEPMIWFVAEALADCGSSMLQGGTGRVGDDEDDEEGEEVEEIEEIEEVEEIEDIEEDEEAANDENDEAEPLEPWEQIVHRDLKPQNIFLHVPNRQSIYPFYDVPRVGDYGLAVRTHANDVCNPRWYNTRVGTQGFLAPEQGRHLDATTKDIIDDFPLGEKTNVYGVGLILYCMIMRTTSPPMRAWLGDPTQDNTLQIGAAESAHWSPQLLDLVRDCLRYRPAARPTFAQILQHVALCTDELGLDLTHGMRSGTIGQQQQLMPQFLAERYAMGMARAAVGV